ncbi:hypothetical protein T440DRAFT_313634 [Plenodomus tracheiphilus IPT5]|uniref:Uncharacterized protein n=1 Tax=Plenodomus tracheiphilus IPT5 TaxID=1408161 RepID=A0A6A7BG16_9PLEO|nr:hypothetical protein T440DRAFT_313634 [Plenodomus tracheiphilus IPT5]
MYRGPLDIHAPLCPSASVPPSSRITSQTALGPPPAAAVVQASTVFTSFLPTQYTGTHYVCSYMAASVHHRQTTSMHVARAPGHTVLGTTQVPYEAPSTALHRQQSPSVVMRVRVATAPLLPSPQSPQAPQAMSGAPT